MISLILVIFISFFLGAILAEIAFRFFSGAWFCSQLRQLSMLLQAFRDAEGDDARQTSLLRCGYVTLKFSLWNLILIAGLAAIASLAPLMLNWTEFQQTLYFFAMSVFATAWWMIRRPRKSVSTNNHAR